FATTFYSEWAESLRTREMAKAQGALASLAGYYASRGDFEAASSCMERVLEIDSLDDEAAYQLADYRTRAGQPAAALSILDTFSRSYERELGEPVPERLERLRGRIASGRAG